MGVGATPSATYKLNVNGNVLVQTNLGVNGTARIDGKLVNEGKGMVLSNSTTTLRTGFSSGAFSVSLPPLAFIDISFYITNFTGNNSNVRVSVAQFTPGTGATNWGQVIYTPHTVSASDVFCGGGSSVQVRLQNVGSTTANLGTNAVLHLLSTVTN